MLARLSPTYFTVGACSCARVEEENGNSDGNQGVEKLFSCARLGRTLKESVKNEASGICNLGTQGEATLVVFFSSSVQSSGGSNKADGSDKYSFLC